MSTYIDPKLAAGAGLGPALAMVIWLVAYMFSGTVRTFAADEAMAFGLLILATGTVLGGVLGYFTRNAGSPPPREGKGDAELTPEALAAVVAAEQQQG